MTTAKTNTDLGKTFFSYFVSFYFEQQREQHASVCERARERKK